MDDLNRQSARLRRGLQTLFDELKRTAVANAGRRSGTPRVDVASRTNVELARNVGRPGSARSTTSNQDAPIVQRSSRRTVPAKGGPMADDQQEFRNLSRDELNELAGEDLPERAAMSLVNANIAIPINLAAALNVLSDNATAVAGASQDTPIDQGN